MENIIEKFEAVKGTRFVSAEILTPVKLRKGAPETKRRIRVVMMVGANYIRPEGVQAADPEKLWHRPVTPGLVAHKKTGALYLAGRIRSQVELGYEPAEPAPEHRLAPRPESKGDWKTLRIADLVEIKGLPDLTDED